MSKFLLFFLIPILVAYSSATLANDKYFYSEAQCKKLNDTPSDRMIEIEEMFQDLLQYSGLKGRFYLCPIKSGIAYAANAQSVDEGVIIVNQHIGYRSDFMRKLRNKVGYWGVFGILAHELAHHYLGHTLDGVGSRPDKELKADFLAGMMMQLSGASIENAMTLPSQPFLRNGGKTHPKGSDRIIAFKKGWLKGCESNATAQCPKHVRKKTVISDDPNFQETRFYLPFLKKVETYKGKAITDEYCKLYSRLSLAQTKRNKKHRCGYLVDSHKNNRWSTNTRSQYYWCMSVSAYATEKEAKVRETNLKSCIKSPPKTTPIPKKAHTKHTHTKQTCTRNSAMHKAAAHGDINVIKQCLNKGVNVNIKEKNHWTPLHSAAQNGRLGIVKLLIQRGAHVNARDVNQRTPLDFAIISKRSNTAKYLTSKGGVTRR